MQDDTIRVVGVGVDLAAGATIRQAHHRVEAIEQGGVLLAIRRALVVQQTAATADVVGVATEHKGDTSVQDYVRYA